MSDCQEHDDLTDCGWCEADDGWEEVKRLSAEIEQRDEIIAELVQELRANDVDHTSACMNWALCEHSQIECALCRAKDLLPTKHSIPMSESEQESMHGALQKSVKIVPEKDSD